MQSVLSASLGIATIAIYYLIVWWRAGRDPKAGTIVIQYDPPRALSAAMMRYIWTQRYDERVLWAALASLVAKGLAQFGNEGSVATVKAVRRAHHVDPLASDEEAVLALLRKLPEKGSSISLLEPSIANISATLADVLRSTERGRWFRLNRREVVGGAILSVIAVVVQFVVAVGDPIPEEMGALAWAGGLVLASAYYFFFLVQRLLELARVFYRNPSAVLIRRFLVFAIMAMGCVAGLTVGMVVLGGNFGAPIVIVGSAGLLLTALFLYLMKAPTEEGRKLLDEIEGFRQFLFSVEQLPLDRPDMPATPQGLYEKYLPYALALEVEQQWCDRFNALASTQSLSIAMERANVYCIGMWDGRPVEVGWAPRTSSRG